VWQGPDPHPSPAQFLPVDSVAVGEGQDWLDSWFEEQVARPQSSPCAWVFFSERLWLRRGMDEYEASHGILKRSTAWIIDVCAQGGPHCQRHAHPRAGGTVRGGRAAAVVSHVSLAHSCLGHSANGGPDLIYHRLGEILPGFSSTLARPVDSPVARLLCNVPPGSIYPSVAHAAHPGVETVVERPAALHAFCFSSDETGVCRPSGQAVRQAGRQAVNRKGRSGTVSCQINCIVQLYWIQSGNTRHRESRSRDRVRLGVAKECGMYEESQEPRTPLF